jgi:transcriptional regulator with XRE-family HTH domain
MTPPKPKRGRPANDPGLRKDWSGAALRAQRNVAGYTLKTLSAAIALREVTVGRSTIGRWERGENAPNAEQLAALCDVFGCRPTVFSKPPQLLK